MIHVHLRQGIGVDIEYNQTICYMAETGDGRDVMLTFQGVIILLPFVKIHIGDFTEVFEMVQK